MVKQTILSMLLLFAAIVAHAQGGQVNGQVKDAMGESVIGATVAEAGNPKNATVTDYDGHFVLKLSGKGRQVVVSYVGMKPKTVKLSRVLSSVYRWKKTKRHSANWKSWLWVMVWHVGAT